MKKKTAKKPATKKAVKKPAAKKPVAKKVAVKAVKADHRKRRGGTAPNRALSTKTVAVKVTKGGSETAKNKKVAKLKWVKKGPKKLPKVKPTKIVKEEKTPVLPPVKMPAELDFKPTFLRDLTKEVGKTFPEQVDPVSGAPKPWGSISAPFVPVTASVATADPVPVTSTIATAPVVQTTPTAQLTPITQFYAGTATPADPWAGCTPVRPA